MPVPTGAERESQSCDLTSNRVPVRERCRCKNTTCKKRIPRTYIDNAQQPPKLPLLYLAEETLRTAIQVQLR